MDGLREELNQAEKELSQRECKFFSELARLDRLAGEPSGVPWIARSDRARPDLRSKVVERGPRKKNPLGRTRLASDSYDLERIFSKHMSDIVGIDLGTTNSLIGVMDSGFPILIADRDGSRLTPSVVYFPETGRSHRRSFCGSDALVDSRNGLSIL